MIQQWRRINAIIAGPNAQAFNQDLQAIANGNFEIGRLNEAIDNSMVMLS